MIGRFGRPVRGLLIALFGGILLMGGAQIVTRVRRFEEGGWNGPLTLAKPSLPHAGSGIVVSGEGHILTASSLLEGAVTIAVEVSDQDRRYHYVADVLARDPTTGLALLKIPAPTKRAMMWSRVPVPDNRTPVQVMGWPLLAAVGKAVHESDATVSANELAESSLQYSLGAGFEGAPVISASGNAIGIVVRTSVGDNLDPYPRVIGADEVARFLDGFDIELRRGSDVLRRPWRVRLRQIQNYTVQVERMPPLRRAAIPVLAWRTRVPADDLIDLSVRSQWRDIVVYGWRPPARIAGWRLTPTAGALQTASDLRYERSPGPMVFPRTLRTPYGRYRLTLRGELTCRTGPGDQIRNLTEANGLRPFWARGAFEASKDGQVVLVGNALLAARSGAVLWRLSVRPGDTVALMPDGGSVIIARSLGSNRGCVERWNLPAIAGVSGRGGATP